MNDIRGWTCHRPYVLLAQVDPSGRVAQRTYIVLACPLQRCGIKIQTDRAILPVLCYPVTRNRGSTHKNPRGARKVGGGGGGDNAEWQTRPQTQVPEPTTHIDDTCPRGCAKACNSLTFGVRSCQGRLLASLLLASLSARRAPRSVFTMP